MSNKIIEEMLDEVFEGCVADKLRIGQDAGGGNMSEQRTAQQIRAYLAEDMKLHRFAELAGEDILRLLDAAVKLRRRLAGYYLHIRREYPHAAAELKDFLAATAWLAEPSPAADVADGESGEGEA